MLRMVPLDLPYLLLTMAAGAEETAIYVARGTVKFTDNGFDFSARPRTGTWYYRVSAVDAEGREGDPTPSVPIAVPPDGAN
jgi:hypothetical protein